MLLLVIFLVHEQPLLWKLQGSQVICEELILFSNADVNILRCVWDEAIRHILKTSPATELSNSALPRNKPSRPMERWSSGSGLSCFHLWFPPKGARTNIQSLRWEERSDLRLIGQHLLHQQSSSLQIPQEPLPPLHHLWLLHLRPVSLCAGEGLTFLTSRPLLLWLSPLRACLPNQDEV